MSSSVSIEAETPAPDWIARFVDDIPTGVALFDRELRYVAANASWVKAFRLAAAPLAGQRHDELDSVGGSQFAELQRRAIAGEIVSGCDSVETDAAGRLWQRAVSFRPRRARDGSVLGIMAAMQEVVTAPSANITQPTPDRLTGIPGREAFLGRLRATLKPVGGVPRPAAMFLIDIDDFKGINDLYGTRIGDRVLKTVAARLLTGIRSRPTPPGRSERPVAPRGADLVARLGADEFGIVLGNATPTQGDADAFARRLLQLIATPINVGDQRIRLTANVGYMISTPTHLNEDDALRDLNVALQEAKLRGPHSARAWDPGLTSSVGRRLALLDELRRALEENEFVLHYQPILGLADQRVVGAEALLRWNHPTEGIVPPKDFLPLLEESGLIVQVGCWVIREVVRQMQV